MKAVVHEGPDHGRVEDVPDARIARRTDRSRLAESIVAGEAEPSFVVIHELPLEAAPQADEHVDARGDGWTEVVLEPATAG